MANSSTYQKLFGFCILACITFLLAGCAASTDNRESDDLTLYVSVKYSPATGEANVGIDIETLGIFGSPLDLDLGDGDTVVISSGDNITVISNSPEDTYWTPIIVDPASKLSVDFQRNGESLKKITANIDTRLFPTIESDAYKLNSSVRHLNASLDYGVTLPHSIETGLYFGHDSMPVRCYSEDTGLEDLEEQEDQSLVGNFFWPPAVILPSPIDESALNQQLSANTLLAIQHQNLLTSGSYEYCETQLYSFVQIAKPFSSDANGQTFASEYASFSEEGDLVGSLFIRLVSEPLALQIDGTSLIP